MDGMPIKTALDVLSNFGIGGLVLILSWLYQRQIDRILRETKKHHEDLMNQYRQHFEALKRMYENNAELLKRHQSLSEDMKDIVVMNTQALTALNDSIRSNEYCPLVRTKKELRTPGLGTETT